MGAHLISVDDVKDFLPIRDGLTKYDDKIRAILDGVTTQFGMALRRNLVRGAVVEHHDTLDTRSWHYDLLGLSDDGLIASARAQSFWLNTFALQESPAPVVAYDPHMVFPGTSILEPGEDYVVDYDHSRIVLKAGTVRAIRALRVSYTGGFAVTDGVLQGVPEDILLAAKLQALHMWNRVNPESVSVSSDRNDGYKVGTPLAVKGGLLPDVIALLAPYRRVTMRG